MKAYQRIILVLILITSGALLRAQNAGDILKTPEQTESIIHAIVNNHELMLKLIAAIKENDHAKMMIDHLMGDESASGMDHENCPMKDEPSASKTSSPDPKSPYVGEETRAVKALSSDDIKKYLGGEGMGQAKAAELNHYPGPKHILELGDKIQLTSGQKVKVQREFDTMHEQAVRLGKKIVEKEEALDKLFASGKITEEKLQSTTIDIGRLSGELRGTHLRAHLAMRKLLSDEQVGRYNGLRGYSSGSEHSAH